MGRSHGGSRRISSIEWSYLDPLTSLPLVDIIHSHTMGGAQAEGRDERESEMVHFSERILYQALVFSGESHIYYSGSAMEMLHQVHGIVGTISLVLVLSSSI